MKTRTINPTPWLQAFQVNHAVEVIGGERTLYLAGQTSTSADGTAKHADDIGAQFKFAWANLKDALQEAAMSPANIVRLNVYTTDVNAFMAVAEQSFGLVAADGCKPATTLLGVEKLYDPSIMIELEGTAVA